MTALRLVLDQDDLQIVHQLAHRIWWPTYRDYLDPLQIETMLADMYSLEALTGQQADGISFTLWLLDNEPAGFVGYGVKPSAISAGGADKTSQTDVMRIEKLYVLPEAQGNGGGRTLIDHVTEEAKARLISRLELNVNRYNPAQLFYRRLGFTVVEEIDIPYGAFFLNDYIMQKNLLP